MSHLRFSVNPEEIAEQFGAIKQQVVDAIQNGVKALAAATHQYILDQSGKLRTSSRKYREAVGFEQVAPHTYVVSLDEKMLWREDGKAAWNMTDTHLKNNFKVNAKGEKYKVIPFEHGGGPTMNSDKTMGFLQILKSALKDRGISIGKDRRGLETDIRGNPKLGVLHRFNIPGKQQDFASPRPSAKAKFDVFSGLQISQKMGEKAGQTIKNITTFRVMKESHKGEGLWEHPGVKALNLFEKATVWAEVEWEQNFLPDILKSF